MEDSTIRKMMATEYVLHRCNLISTWITENKHIAEDIMQTAFLDMLENEVVYGEYIDTPEDFFRDFRRVAYNAYCRYLYEMSKLVEIEDNTATVEMVSEIELDDIIANLPGKLSKVARMLVDGFSISDIAGNLGYTDRTIRLYREKLRECLT